jgi:hypothetical protein
LIVTIAVIAIVVSTGPTVNTSVTVETCLIIGGTIVFIVVVVVMQYRQGTQMRGAIAEESKKYSARSSTPCSWRLETTEFFSGWGHNYQANYRVTIFTIESRISEIFSVVYFIDNH